MRTALHAQPARLPCCKIPAKVVAAIAQSYLPVSMSLIFNALYPRVLGSSSSDLLLFIRDEHRIGALTVALMLYRGAYNGVFARPNIQRRAS
jgi:hypothetical protein